MDIAQFAEQEAKLSAQLFEALKGGATDAAAALGKPGELQQQQIDRVTDRIRALEEEKVAVAARIDAEIAELKGELDQRQRALEATRGKTVPAPTSAPSGQGPGPLPMPPGHFGKISP